MLSSSSTSLVSFYMGQTSSKAHQASPSHDSRYRLHTKEDDNLRHQDDAHFDVLRAPYAAEESLQASMYDHSSSRGLFLSPVVTNDSSFSSNTASSVTKDFTLVDPNVMDETKSESFSPLLSLPMEILYQIVEIVYYDETTSSIPANLEKFSKTIPVLSKTFNQLAMRFLYKYAIFTRPHSFDKFLQNILNQPDLGMYVEFLDFQTFTSIGLGRTGRMNQEIQMVTSQTIELALRMCPNLIEFMASENIQDDMDVTVLSMLFNHLPKIQAMDFCGASSSALALAFNELQIENSDVAEHESMTDSCSTLSIKKGSLNNLFKISFHDCSNLAPSVFEKLLPHFIHLRRLDLNHTSITSSILLSHLPHSCRLTHLSLARCSKLTTKDLINFLVNHPAVANESLQWLNLQIDPNVVSPLSEVYLLYVLNHLKAPNLQYFNLGGLPVNSRILKLIKNKFVKLESLTISHSTVEICDLEDFMHENDTIKFLDLTSVKALDRWKFTNFLKTCYNSNLQAIEFDYKVLYDVTGGNYVRVDAVQTDFRISGDPQLPQVWRFYDNEGRRAWIYKIDSSDPSYASIISGNKSRKSFASNLVYYDLETGAKIETKSEKPAFLKYASRKVNCSIGYYNLNNTKKKKYIKGELHESVWPVEFSQRGIYNYYSLNVK
ncbi:hypothetical protein CJJ07_004081 [Candidozyma auris]|nr:hypothetical protein CJJ07_004081 [[Candida] auris]